VPSTALSFSSRDAHRNWLAQHATLPAGFRVGTTRFDFVPREAPKPAKMTLTLIALDKPTPDFAAVFTKNAFPGAPVIVGRARLSEPTLGAILVNNKISNVCAPGGVEASERLCGELAKQLGLSAGQVLPSSTGVIGWTLPVDAMLPALPKAVEALTNSSVLPAAEGIVTTDLYPKIRSVQLGGGRIVGIAKGAGMIEPNMATMLVYIMTDLVVPRDTLRATSRASSIAPSTASRSIAIRAPPTPSLRSRPAACRAPIWPRLRRHLPRSAATSQRMSCATAKACAT